MAPSIFLIANTKVLAVALVALSLYGFSLAVKGVNEMPILCQVTDARYRATGFGVMNMFAGIASGAAVLAWGALRDAQISLGACLQFSAIGIAVCAALLFGIRPRPQTEC